MALYDNHRYSVLRPTHAAYIPLLAVLCIGVALGGYCAMVMEHAGHAITGMNNHVVWGLPHVFAVSLIVTASGALNGATLSSVFNLAPYKPFARLSIVLAMSLLLGGLMVLVLDLGRPDRLIVAMTHYNFRSIFSWNIIVYTGFLALGVLYLWVMMERRFNIHVVTVGRMAFIWRIVLTSGTGSIFGFLVGRDALDTALLAPLFIALSLLMGTAMFALQLVVLEQWRHGVLSSDLVQSMRKFLVWFLFAVAYFSVVHHLTNLYVAEHNVVERNALMGAQSPLFWIGHVAVGIALPLCLLLYPSVGTFSIRKFVIACCASLIGGMILVNIVIVGSQSMPQRLFPGKTVLESRFGDAGFAAYSPSAWEWGLGAGGIAIALLACLVIVRVLPVTPQVVAQPARSS